MATKIRLARFGRKKKPFYRIVVADGRSPRDGRHLEKIGYYDPLTEPKTIKIDKERALYWLNTGAIPTDTTRNLLSSKGIMLEWDLRKRGKSDPEVQEEIQKFDMVREQQMKKSEEAKKARAAEAAAKAEAEKKAADEAAKAAEEAEKAETAEEPVEQAVEAETAAESDESTDENQSE